MMYAFSDNVQSYYRKIKAHKAFRAFMFLMHLFLNGALFYSNIVGFKRSVLLKRYIFTERYR